MGYKKKKAIAKKPTVKQISSPSPSVQQQQQQQQQYSIPTFEQDAQTFKDIGNDHVKKGEYVKALIAYEKGLTCFEQYSNMLQPNQHIHIQNALYSNRALCYLKLEQFDDAEKECTKALQKQQQGQYQSKIWYRRALAREGRARKMVLSKVKQLNDNQDNNDNNKELINTKNNNQMNGITQKIENYLEPLTITTDPPIDSIPNENTTESSTVQQIEIDTTKAKDIEVTETPSTIVSSLPSTMTLTRQQQQQQQQQQQEEMKRERHVRYQIATELLLLAQEDLLQCVKLLEHPTSNGSSSPDHGMKRSMEQLKGRLQKTILEYRQKSTNTTTSTSLEHPDPSEQRSTVLLLLSNRRTCLSTKNATETPIALAGEAFFLLDWDWWYKWCLYVGLIPPKPSLTNSSNTNTTSLQLLSLLPNACALEPRNDDDDDSSDDDGEDDSDNDNNVPPYEPYPPGPIDNTQLILEFPNKITTANSTRDAFYADWYRCYQDQLATMDCNENEKENVNGDNNESSLSYQPTSSHGTLPSVLKPNLVRGYHFEAIPREVYSALRTWYGEVSPTICRRVIQTKTGDFVLPLYCTSEQWEDPIDKKTTTTTTTTTTVKEGPFPCFACGARRATSRCQRCLVARYCNRSCQESHWSYHKHECKKQSMDVSVITWNDGTCRVGLNNLGNTCFMNAALQALSHTLPLTRHFLSGTYKMDLNPDNPLGTGGKLADAYAAVLKDMWWNRNRHLTSISPTALKRAIALFAPRFAGYIQHDSQEFLAYFLDGLHEDLNRIRKAPYVEMPDVTDGQNMNVAASRAWEAHCRRNDSLVMDTFYGQFKSTCVCPKCNRISLSFDAFNHVSLEIPQAKNALQPITVLVFPAGKAKTPIRYTVEIPRNKTILDLRNKIGELSGIVTDRLIICEILDHIIVDRPKLSTPVSDILPDDIMVAYEIEHVGTVFNVVVSHSLIEENDGNESENEMKMEPFGFPLMTTCPKDWTCQQVWDYLWAKVSHFRTTEGNKNDMEDDAHKKCFQIRLQDRRQKSLCIFPSKNDNDSPYLPSNSEEKLIDILGLYANDPYLFLSLDWFEQSSSSEPMDLDQFTFFKDHISWIEISRRKQQSSNNKMHGVTLDQCFDAFTTPERLDSNNTWYCSNCKEHVQAMKTMELWRLPNVLILHLKRFEFKNILRRDKLDTLVHFPLTSLDMSRHCASRTEKDTFTYDNVPAIYDLFAVTNHYGRMGAGHYTAFARSWNECSTEISEEWSLFDDSHVRPIDNTHATDMIVTPAAYVLFYRRRIFH